MRIPRILLADDHSQILTNLCRLAEEGGEVVGAVHDGCAVIAEALRLHPDVIILDLTMPMMSGLDAARKLRRDMPECKVVICTVHESQQLIEAAFAAGAMGFVRKQSAHTDLVAAIHAVHTGDRFMSPSLFGDGGNLKTKDSARDFYEGGER